MITQKVLERYMNEAVEIAREAETAPEVAERVMKAIENHIVKNRRRRAPPPPEGGITLNQAGGKYGIAPQTIHRWAKMGIIPILSKTMNCVYVDAKATENAAKKYLAAPGRGKRTVYQK